MPAFKPDKLKINLRLSINRLKLLEKKKTEQAMKARKEIADYIKQRKTDRAKIRVEHIIREDYMVEALEIIELFCDMLLARFGLIETMSFCEEGLQEAVCTLIWVAPRLSADVKELDEVSKQLGAKYGPEFHQQARSNKMNMVSEKVITKLGVEPPSHQMVDSYMAIIAENYNVPYERDPSAAFEDNEEVGIDESAYIPSVQKGGPPGGGYGAPGGGGGGGGNFQYPGPPKGVPQYPGPPMGNSNYPGPPVGNQQFPGPPTGNPAYNPGPPPSQQWSQPPTGPTGGAYPPRGYGGPPPGGNYPPQKGHPPPQDSHLPYPSGSEMHKMPSGPNESSLEGLDLPPVPTHRLSGEDSSAGNDSGDVDFDDLTRRFEQLKKRK